MHPTLFFGRAILNPLDSEQIPIENQTGDGDIDEDDSVALAVENTISSEEEPVKSLDDSLDSVKPEKYYI